LVIKLLDRIGYGMYRYTLLALLWLSYFLLFYGLYSLVVSSNINNTFKNIITILWIAYTIYNMYNIYSINYKSNQLVDEIQSKTTTAPNDFISWFYDISHYTLYSILLVIILAISTFFYNTQIAGIFTGFIISWVISYGALISYSLYKILTPI
jgi:hypothetical protein